MNIDLLRWILAGCGAILVLGIYLRERFRRKLLEGSKTGVRAEPDSSAETLMAGYRAGLAEDLELPSLHAERAFDDMEIPETGTDADDDSKLDASHADDTFGIVQIKVAAHEGMCFSGRLLIEALEAVGLEYGSMNIFHRQTSCAAMPLFSVVNMVEPGTFPVNDPSHFESPGVVFFLQVAVAEQPVAAFDEMLRTAQILAARIGGEVRDEHNLLLTVEKTEAIRGSLKPGVGCDVPR